MHVLRKSLLEINFSKVLQGMRKPLKAMFNFMRS